MKFVIVCSHIFPNDAIGHDILVTNRILKEAGFESSIYGDYYDDSIKNLSISKNEMLEIISKPENVLIYQLANHWSEGEYFLRKAKCKIVLRYHNTTPAKFFRGYSPVLIGGAQLAIDQTKRIINECRYEMVISASSYNNRVLEEYGADPAKLRVVSPFNVLKDYEEISKKENIKLSTDNDDIVKVLFVGRTFPNKGHIHLIETIKSYVELFDKRIVLNIVGKLDPLLNKYYLVLRNLISVYGLKKKVFLRGRAEFKDLVSIYGSADVFLLMSEHEGFGVPALEAQYNEVPLVAYGSSALKETIGPNQIVFDNLDYDNYASAINRVVKDSELREFVIKEGLKNCEKYTEDKLAANFIKYLKEL